MFGRKEPACFHIVHWHRLPSRVGDQLIFSAWSQDSLIVIDTDTGSQQRILHEEKSGHVSCHINISTGCVGTQGWAFLSLAPGLWQQIFPPAVGKPWMADLLRRVQLRVISGGLLGTE